MPFFSPALTLAEHSDSITQSEIHRHTGYHLVIAPRTRTRQVGIGVHPSSRVVGITTRGGCRPDCRLCAGQRWRPAASLSPSRSCATRSTKRTSSAFAPHGFGIEDSMRLLESGDTG